MEESKTEANELLHQERRRIHQDAHDKVYNRLSAVAKKSEQLSFEVPEQKDKLDKISNLIRQSVTDLQDIINDKGNSSFNSSAFVKEKIKQMCTEHKFNYGQEVSFAIKKGRYYLLDNNSNWHLLCILQECLSNAGKHSQADRICVSIYKQDTHLNLEVEDNGIGICKSPNQIEPNIKVGRVLSNTRKKDKNSGIGLHGIRQRVKNLGGQLNLHSGANSGTLVKVQIPLQ